MAVILPNATLGVRVRTHPFSRDAHGVPYAGPIVETRGPWPGSAIEQEDGTWNLRVDPRAWTPTRLDADDQVFDTTRTWIVISASIHQVPSYDDVDYVGVRATLEPPRVP